MFDTVCDLPEAVRAADCESDHHEEPRDEDDEEEDGDVAVRDDDGVLPQREVRDAQGVRGGVTGRHGGGMRGITRDSLESFM